MHCQSDSLDPKKFPAGPRLFMELDSHSVVLKGPYQQGLLLIDHFDRAIIAQGQRTFYV